LHTILDFKDKLVRLKKNPKKRFMSKSANMASNNTVEVKFRFQVELRGPLGAGPPRQHFSQYSIKHGRNVFNKCVEIVPGLKFMAKLCLGYNYEDGAVFQLDVVNPHLG
jgi:hypothetical protein